MADYIPILNTQIEPQAPVTSELMFQLRDNPEAIAEGAVGASRILANATSGSIAGGNLLFGCGDVVYILAEEFVPDATFKATSTCQVRVNLSLSASAEPAAPNEVSFQVYKNSAVVLTASSTSTTYTNHSVDVSLVRGDIIRIFGQDADTGELCRLRNIRYTVGAQITVGGI